MITAIGPYINLISGITAQRVPIFALWVVLGETLWVLAYVTVGPLFGDKIAEIGDALGDFSIAAAAAVGVLLDLLVRNLKKRAVATPT